MKPQLWSLMVWTPKSKAVILLIISRSYVVLMLSLEQGRQAALDRWLPHSGTTTGFCCSHNYTHRHVAEQDTGLALPTRLSGMGGPLALRL